MRQGKKERESGRERTKEIQAINEHKGGRGRVNP